MEHMRATRPAESAAAVTPLVADFRSPESDVRALVGGKAASLGRMVKAGLPVPPGFAVTTAAYARFLEAAGLQHRILEMAAGLRYDDADQLESQTDAIRELIRSTPIPA